MFIGLGALDSKSLVVFLIAVLFPNNEWQTVNPWLTSHCSTHKLQAVGLPYYL